MASLDMLQAGSTKLGSGDRGGLASHIGKDKFSERGG